MTNVAEDTLYACLTEVDELEAIAQIGITGDAIPTEGMRPVVAWAIDYFYESGMRRAPSRDALLDAWGRKIDDAGVKLIDEQEEHDNAEWAIEQLKANYVSWKFQAWLKDQVRTMADSPEIHRRGVVESALVELGDLAMALRDGTNQKEGTEGFLGALAEYKQREAEGQIHRGMTFGLKEVDQHTYGIHPGELAVVGAGAKMGKSLFTAWVVLNEWLRGRTVVLFTMENSVDMTYNRLVCIQLGIEPMRWEEGTCTEDEKRRVQEFIDVKLPQLKDKLIVLQPQENERTAQSLVRTARSLGAESVIIDQLTFMEPSDRRLTGHHAIKSILHSLKTEITQGRYKLPCLLVHQFSREGMAALKKNSEIQPWMFADGSEVERTADWAFGLHASDDDLAARAMDFQTILARRRKAISWKLIWRPFNKNIQVYHELTKAQMRGELKNQ